jgi:hypothetical protein
MDRPGQLLRDRISGHSDPREIKEALRSAFAANPWLYEFARNKLPPGQADLCGAVVIQAEADLYDHINRFREKRAGHTATVAIEPFLDAFTREGTLESPPVEQ